MSVKGRREFGRIRAGVSTLDTSGQDTRTEMRSCWRRSCWPVVRFAVFPDNFGDAVAGRTDNELDFEESVLIFENVVSDDTDTLPEGVVIAVEV